MDLGKVIKELRQEKGVTRTQFANDLNVHPGTVGNWEINKRQPEYEVLIRIADYFGVTTDYLLGRQK